MKRRPLAAASVIVLCVVSVAAPATSASADAPRAPGSFTGYGFDTCTAPSQAVMDAWWRNSPFSAVGIYISGASRSCAQPELTPEWVRTQADDGWRFLPLHLGRQAPCIDRQPRIARDPGRARAQGVDAAKTAVARADVLGLRPGSVLYLDIEWYDITRRGCNAAVLSFVSGWTQRLHRLRYRSGVYSSASAAIRALDQARIETPARYNLPDQLWVGWSNGRADVEGEPYLSDEGWMPHRRIHQYVLDTYAAYGGVTLRIDRNWLDVGQGSVAPTPRRTCGRQLGFTSYPARERGDRGRLVSAAQCLLRQHGTFDQDISGVFGRPTVQAVHRYQQLARLPDTGTLTRRTWVALLSAGSRGVAKLGSASQAVWRLQRALTAAIREPVPVTGVFDATTAHAVATYERAHGLARTEVADADIWSRLHRGQTGTAARAPSVDKWQLGREVRPLS